MVETHAHRARFHVTPADNEHRVDAQLFRIPNYCLDRIVAEVGAHAGSLAAQFPGDVLRVFHERGGREILFRADGDDAHLIRRERAEKIARRGGSARRRDALKGLLSKRMVESCRSCPVPRWGGAGHFQSGGLGL